MAETPELSYCAERVRRFDPDRYLTTLFAPPAQREALYALYAFNLEIGSVREQVREALMGHIRLQWWRESIEGIFAGTPRRHAVVQPLAAVVQEHGLQRELIDQMIDAREGDLSDDPPPSLPALEAYAEATSGSLTQLAMAVLNTPETGRNERLSAAGRSVGSAWALVGLCRAVPFHARARRLYLPRDLLEKHGADLKALYDLKSSPGLCAAVQDVAAVAQQRLERARTAAFRAPRQLLSPLLCATLADGYLCRLRQAGFDPFDARVQQPPPGRLWRLLLRFASATV